MLSDEETSQSIARKIATEYYAFCMGKYGHGPWISIPKPGSKTEASSVDLWGWLKGNKVKSILYFELAHGLFSPGWIKKTFKQPYLPFMLAIGCRDQVIARWREPVKGTEAEEAERLKKILQNFKPETRQAILEVGLDWVAPDIRSKLEKEIL